VFDVSLSVRYGWLREDEGMSELERGSGTWATAISGSLTVTLPPAFTVPVGTLLTVDGDAVGRASFEAQRILVDDTDETVTVWRPVAD
jgi:hypothetical protein